MRFSLLLFAAFATLLSSPALADVYNPTGFVLAIYKSYEGKNAKGQRTDTRAAVRGLFTPSLAKLISDDSEPAARRGEVGLLDFDPFTQGQDFDVSGVKVGTEPTGPGRARATATYLNFGKAATTRLDLVQGPSGWRVDDIRWADGGTPRQLFTRKR